MCGREGTAKALSLPLSLSLSLCARAASGVTVGKDLEDKQHHTYTPSKTVHIRTYIHTHTQFGGQDSQLHTQILTHTKARQQQASRTPSPISHIYTALSGKQTQKKGHTGTERPVVGRLDAEVRLQ